MLSSLLGPSKGLSWCLAKTCAPALLAGQGGERMINAFLQLEGKVTQQNSRWEGREWGLESAQAPLGQTSHPAPRGCTSRTAIGKRWGPAHIPDLSCTTFKSTGRQHPEAGHTEVLEVFLLIRVRMRRRSWSKWETEQAADVSLRWRTNKKHEDNKWHFYVQESN